jgi:hypothetical protein
MPRRSGPSSGMSLERASVRSAESLPAICCRRDLRSHTRARQGCLHPRRCPRCPRLRREIAAPGGQRAELGGSHEACTAALFAGSLAGTGRTADQASVEQLGTPVTPGPYDDRKHSKGILTFRDEAASDLAALHQLLVVWPVHVFLCYAFAGCATTRTAVRAGMAPSARSALQTRAWTSTRSPTTRSVMSLLP